MKDVINKVWLSETVPSHSSSKPLIFSLAAPTGQTMYRVKLCWITENERRIIIILSLNNKLQFSSQYSTNSCDPLVKVQLKLKLKHYLRLRPNTATVADCLTGRARRVGNWEREITALRLQFRGVLIFSSQFPVLLDLFLHPHKIVLGPRAAAANEKPLCLFKLDDHLLVPAEFFVRSKPITCDLLRQKNTGTTERGKHKGINTQRGTQDYGKHRKYN